MALKKTYELLLVGHHWVKSISHKSFCFINFLSSSFTGFVLILARYLYLLKILQAQSYLFFGLFATAPSSIPYFTFFAGGIASSILEIVVAITALYLS